MTPCFIAFNPNYGRGSVTYRKISVVADGIGAFCVVYNPHTGKVQRQTHLGKINPRVFASPKSLGFKYVDIVPRDSSFGAVDLDMVKKSLDELHYCKDTWGEFRVASCYLLSSFFKFHNRILDEVGPILAKEGLFEPLKKVCKLVMERTVQGNRGAEGPPPPAADGVDERAHGGREDALTEAHSVNIEKRGRVFIGKMKFANHLDGFTDGNFYEIKDTSGDFAVVNNDFGIECNVLMKRFETSFCFSSPPVLDGEGTEG